MEAMHRKQFLPQKLISVHSVTKSCGFVSTHTSATFFSGEMVAHIEYSFFFLLKTAVVDLCVALL